MFIQYAHSAIALKEDQEYSIGRSGSSAIINIDDPSISRMHALVWKSNGKVYLKDLDSSNGSFVNGKRITAHEPVEIKITDRIKIATSSLILIEKAEDITPVKSERKAPPAEIQEDFKKRLSQEKILYIGRSSTNDIVLEDPTVSRRHAKLTYENDVYWIEDLGATNKTYYNGKVLKTKQALKRSDRIVISFYSITLSEGVINLKEQHHAISGVAIQKKYPNNKIGLQSMSLEVPHKNFAALMGPSGCGKSTLLKCLNGDNPATSGEVFIHGLSLQENFKLIKKKIGYVPQDDIIHRELSVYKTLYYAAKLRLPDDTSNEEIDSRINKVIESLKLDQDKHKDIREIAVGNLSGGQRKRISIAVELLTQPTILFLDEPTSPLDPETIESFLTSLQDLAKQGTTIIMVTHKPEDLNYVDQVIFLGVQGHLTYKGPAKFLTAHFEVDTIVEVYSKMSEPEAVQQYYQKPHENNPATITASEIKRDRPDSLWLQLYWLTLRYLKIKLNDRANLFLLLAQPVIIGGLVSLVFSEFRVGVLFLTAISAIWFGVSNAAKEIVGELSVYRRERMFNLNIHTYILSKCIVLALIAFIQIVVFITIIYWNFKGNTVSEFPETYLQPFWESVGFMFYISCSATLIGLLLSSYFSSTEKVMTVVPITLMPQILLAGVMTKIDTVFVEILSFFTLGRWGTEGFSRLQDQYFEEKGGAVESVLAPEFVVDPNALSDCNCQATQALDQLGLYDQRLMDNGTLIGSFFDSLSPNLLAILVLDVLMYFFIYYFLKNKDSIS
ncbi:FHA domain-containing protein [Spongiimicrobium salis]|uniref:FHA domain-containing protein n=1 Tax=Spongiimicrobium salis TaxID=1667022 RepID=UPI00374D76B0